MTTKSKRSLRVGYDRARCRVTRRLELGTARRRPRRASGNGPTRTRCTGPGGRRRLGIGGNPPASAVASEIGRGLGIGECARPARNHLPSALAAAGSRSPTSVFGAACPSLGRRRQARAEARAIAGAVDMLGVPARGVLGTLGAGCACSRRNASARALGDRRLGAGRRLDSRSLSASVAPGALLRLRGRQADSRTCPGRSAGSGSTRRRPSGLGSLSSSIGRITAAASASTTAPTSGDVRAASVHRLSGSGGCHERVGMRIGQGGAGSVDAARAPPPR